MSLVPTDALRPITERRGEDGMSQLDDESKSILENAQDLSTVLDEDPFIKGVAAKEEHAAGLLPKATLLRESELQVIAGLGRKPSVLVRQQTQGLPMMESTDTLDLTVYSQIPRVLLDTTKDPG